MRTKRQETIDNLTKDLSPKDKQKLVEFWSGKRVLNGNEYIKFAARLEEFDRTMKTDSIFEDFLRESKRPY